MSSNAVRTARPESQPRTAIVDSFDGTKIHYDLYEGASDATVLVVPGFWRDRKHASMVRLARFLNVEGYRAAVVDVRGHGESGGTYGFNVHEHHDVAAVAHDLLARSPATTRLTLIGFSYGGAIAIAATARHPLPVASLLLISAVADFRMISPRINPLTIHRHVSFFSQALRRPRIAWSMRKSERLRAVDDIRHVQVPTCMIHVKNDWLIGHRHSMVLYEAANEPKELHLLDIEGNYHADRIFNVASDTVEPIVRDFLTRHTR